MFSKAENIYDLFATGKKEEAIVVLKDIAHGKASFFRILKRTFMSNTMNIYTNTYTKTNSSKYKVGNFYN